MTRKARAALPIRPVLPADGVVYDDEYRGLREALIPSPRRSNHAASLLELPDGDLLAAWFGGSDEGNHDVDILVARCDVSTGQWSKGVSVTHDPGRADQNPGLFAAGDGRVWLLYTSMLSRQSGIYETFNLQYTSVIKRLVSDNGGATWAGPDTLFDRPGTFARQPIQRLVSGRLLHGQWICFDDDTRNGSDQPVIQHSDDAGATWISAEIPCSAGLVHPNVVELDSGHLVALLRSRRADWVHISHSTDAGATWTPAQPTGLPNNNAGLNALLLPSGRLAVISNEEQFPDPDGEVVWPYERTRMVISVSEDEGGTWPIRRIIEPGDGFIGPANSRSNRRHEYPHAIVARDARIHIAYSYSSRTGIKHVSFEESWIAGTPDQAHTDAKLWS